MTALNNLITDLKAAGANENTLKLAMNCYQLGREEVIFSPHFAAAETARQLQRESDAKLCEDMGIEGYGTLAIAAAIRAGGKP